MANFLQRALNKALGTHFGEEQQPPPPMPPPPGPPPPTPPPPAPPTGPDFPEPPQPPSGQNWVLEISGYVMQDSPKRNKHTGEWSQAKYRWRTLKIPLYADEYSELRGLFRRGRAEEDFSEALNQALDIYDFDWPNWLTWGGDGPESWAFYTAPHERGDTPTMRGNF